MINTVLAPATTSLEVLSKGTEQIRHSIHRLFTDKLGVDSQKDIEITVRWELAESDVFDEEYFTTSNSQVREEGLVLKMVFTVSGVSNFNREIFRQRARVISKSKYKEEQKTAVGYLSSGWKSLSTRFEDPADYFAFRDTISVDNIPHKVEIIVRSFQIPYSDLPYPYRSRFAEQKAWVSKYSLLKELLSDWNDLSRGQVATFKTDFITEVNNILPEESNPEPLPKGESRDEFLREVFQLAGARPDEKFALTLSDDYY